MARSGYEEMHRLSKMEVFEKFQRQSQRRRFLENLRMRDYAQAAAQGQFRDSHSSRLPQCRFQPAVDFTVLLGVLAMGTDENINVQQNHRESIASSRADDEVRSM